MKIIELRAENLKRLSVVEIRPDGALVQITGKNGQGKTSVLDAIWWALDGAKNIQRSPIRDGQQTALIRIDLGTLKVTRTFERTEDGQDFTTKLKVVSDSGRSIKSPQDAIDALTDVLSFDPVAFGRKKPKEQFDMLKALAPGVDFEEIAKARQTHFDDRSIANRQAETLRTQANAITLPPGKVPAAVDLSALEGELARASDHNALVERRKANRESAEQQVKDRRDRAADLRRQAEEVEKAADALQKQIDEAEALPAAIDVAKVQDALAQGREGNRVAESVARRRDLERQATEWETKAETLTGHIKRLDEEKAAKVASAKMPVEGLGFGEDFITLNGQPFDQASDAQQLQASIAIAAAMNPDLRVIRVRDGSLLDDDALKALEAFAEDRDFQVWVERVDSSGEIGFVMENGHLKGEPPPEPAQPAVDEEEPI